MPRPREIWQRNLVVLGAGQLVAISAMGIVIPLIPFFLRELGMTDRAELERWSGLVFSGPFLAAALMSPVWGWLGDRYGHKKMVIRAILGLAVVNLLLVFVQSPLQFLLIRLVQGLVTGFVPAALAITAASTPGDRLPGAMGRLAASASAGRLLGPAIGGILAGFVPFRQLFLIVGLTIGAAAAMVAIRLEEVGLEAGSERPSMLSTFGRSLADPRQRFALAGLFASMIAVSMTMPIFPLYVEDRCGAASDPKLITGIGFAVVAGFTLVGSTLLGRVSDRVGLKRLLVGALILAAASLALHAAIPGIGPMLGLRALLGLSVAGIAPVLHAMIGRAAPEGMKGGTTGVANAATILGFFVGPILGGWLANHVGVDGVFLSAAAVALLCAALAAVVARRVGVDRGVPRLHRDLPR